MLADLRDRLLSESRQYGIYQIWKNYKILDETGDVEDLDVKTNVNALTNLIQIVRFAYGKNQKLTSLINPYMGCCLSLPCFPSLQTDLLAYFHQVCGTE